MRHRITTTNRVARRAGLTAGVSALALVMGGGGGSAPAAAQDTQQADTTMQLEEIVVTARRTEERIIDAPQGINVMTGDYISKQRIETADDVIQFTPGATFIAFNKTQPEYSIRGISQRSEGSSLESSMTCRSRRIF